MGDYEVRRRPSVELSHLQFFNHSHEMATREALEGPSVEHNLMSAPCLPWIQNLLATTVAALTLRAGAD